MQRNPKQPVECISDRIRQARARLGLSQAQAAKKWGLSVRTLQGWEIGRSKPRGLYLKAIERAIGKA